MPTKVYFCIQRHRTCIFKQNDNAICRSCIQNLMREPAIWCFSCKNLLQCELTSQLYTQGSRCDSYIKSPYYCKKAASMCNVKYNSKSEKCQVCQACATK